MKIQFLEIRFGFLKDIKFQTLGAPDRLRLIHMRSKTLWIIGKADNQYQFATIHMLLKWRTIAQ